MVDKPQLTTEEKILKELKSLNSKVTFFQVVLALYIILFVIDVFLKALGI